MNRQLSVLALTVLLGACGRTPEAVTPPVAAMPSALYELHFQNLGSAQTTASAQRLGGGLGAQRLENAPEPLALGTTPLSTLEFVTTENGKSVRHAQATFKLTNTSGRTLKNLVFLPVALNDTDGDPSNNAQAPTAGGTPFRTVRYFDGSDASALAGTLTPVQGQRLNAEKTGAQADPEADAYFRGLSTAGLNVAAPAGLSVQVTDGGWLAATTLAAGASTNVTFAVDMGGVDPANLKATPYSFSLLVTGGEDATATDISSSVDPASLQGVIPDWTSGALSLVGQSEEGPATYGTVSASGLVSASFPAPSTLTPLLNGCTFSGERTAENPSLFLVYPGFRLQNGAGDVYGSLSESTGDLRQRVGRLYSDTDVRLKGTQACFGASTEYDVDLRRGWNVVTFGLLRVTDDDIAVFSTRSLPQGTRTSLRYSPVPERVSVNFPGTFLYELRAGQSVQVDAVFQQNGQISGDVTLETDVPGIGVTPASLSLPALKAAGLGAQAVQTRLTLAAAADVKPATYRVTLTVRKNGEQVGAAFLYVTVNP